jgi:hypothetical protein
MFRTICGRRGGHATSSRRDGRATSSRRDDHATSSRRDDHATSSPRDDRATCSRRSGRSLAAGRSPRTAADVRAAGNRPLRRFLAVAAATLATLAAGAPAALAADYHDAIRDCNDDGVLQGHYTRSTLRQARNHLPASLREYSDCADVLARAIAAAGKNGGTGGGDTSPPLGNPALTTGSGAIASNPDQLNSLRQKTKQSTDDRAPAKVAVGGTPVAPGTAGLNQTAVHASPNELPGSLLIALVALAAMGAIASLLVMRNRWPETRRVALRLLRR